MITARKTLAKFNVFCLRASLLSRRFDVHSSLQVRPRSMFDCVGFSFDLHNRDHVKALELLISFRFKLPCIRGILTSLTIRSNMCSHTSNSDAITSSFAWNFLAQTRSRQLRLDFLAQMRSSCDLCFAFVTCNFVGTLWE